MKKSKKWLESVTSIEIRQKKREIAIRLSFSPPNHSGFKRSDETKKKISLYRTGRPNPCLRGDKNPNWKGGITSKNKKLRDCLEMREWRRKVFQRDKFTCKICGKKGVTLNADHIKSFSLYPELRFNLDNGRTLCVECHKKTENFAGRGQKRACYKSVNI